MSLFQLKTQFSPSGDQGNAIESLTNNLQAGANHQTLLGVTGSGKTFTMANVITNSDKPALILAHNKTLAAQLFSEFREFFPDNAVGYFISYYDYYQPEAYIPRRDLYIEKETDINENIERYRNAAMQALLTRKDVIIVASVSCIYGIGDPEDYQQLSVELKVGDNFPQDKLQMRLTDMQYERSEYDFHSGYYRTRGDTFDVNIASEESAIRIEFFGEEIESIKVFNPITGEIMEKMNSVRIFPAKQFVTPYEKIPRVVRQMRDDLDKEVEAFMRQGKELEAQRLRQRTEYDLEMLTETGYCSGIENYSRYFDQRKPGQPGSTLLDYMPKDWLMFIDESHMTVSQVRGMYNGDRARKQMLVDHGFRMQSAKDNRPLKFHEFNERLDQVIYVSATPQDYELELSKNECKRIGIKSDQKDQNKNKCIVEQLIRPTGLLDPIVEIRPTEAKNLKAIQKDIKEHGYNNMQILEKKDYNENQVDNLIKEIRATIKAGQRVLVTTLTKRMSENLAEYLNELGIKVQYLHSDLDAIERVEILQKLRLGHVDVVVGINLLREGLDLPEVSLVAIMDADKEGFLRSETSLVQTIGRAARHVDGRVVMYADKITGSMKRAIDETRRRREIQERYNIKHRITPKSIKKDVKTSLERAAEDDSDKTKLDKIGKDLFKEAESWKIMKQKERKALKQEIEIQMQIYADSLEFEKAASLRDLLDTLN
ncbi:excinuclease ABC subunit B [Candidatus Dojkabacteria bacterium]|nr:excinuclease ABC subunit B [Candidatus Dojkabacteria bacterium]